MNALSFHIFVYICIYLYVYVLCMLYLLHIYMLDHLSINVEGWQTTGMANNLGSIYEPIFLFSLYCLLILHTFSLV